MRGLLPETQQILDLVRTRSGRDVRFVPDESMAVLATLQLARNGAPCHLLRYKTSDRPIDYFVAYQAGFALRLFANDEDRRFDFAGNEAARSDAEILITAGRRLSDSDREALPHFAATVAHWALMTLRSLPVGMRVDRWIRTTYPVLREQQADGITMLQQQNAAGLSMSVGNLSVPATLMGMNAAYALFCDRLLGGSAYSIAYQAAGVLDEGAELLALWDYIPDDPAHDRELVDTWATALGMRGWYRWIPFQA